jgi:hypothetical protein
MAESSLLDTEHSSQIFSKDAVQPVNPTIPAECYVCQQMKLGFLTPVTEAFNVKLGGANIVVNGNCPAHASVAERVNEYYLKSHSNLVEAEYTLSKRENTTTLGLWIQEKGATTSSGVNLNLVRPESDPNHHGHGRLLDSQWIKSDVLKKWKECCLKEHGADCSNPLKQYETERSIPDWLVDTQQKCLVRAHEDDIYICLSYKWGQSNGLETKKLNLSQLQTPNSLHELRDQIPATIQNAIDIVGLLGERYLWVDRLCIIQDDSEMKSSQLQKMAGIYSNACITIIAADGENAEHGIRGIQGISQSRSENQQIYSFGDTEKLVHAKFQPFSLHKQGYFKRGWTFQEHLFSPRRLIFENKIARWECNRCAWFEDVVFSEGPEAHYKVYWTEILHARFPSLDAYCSIISQYNHRELTYPEDGLPAIYGLVSVLQQAFPDGFLCGLPEFYFDTALAWAPWTPQMTRRVSSELSPLNAGSLTCLPSWSWVGWQGMVAAWNWRGDRDFIKKGRFGTSERTIPITKWYTAATVTSENKRLIKSRFLNEREFYKKAAEPLGPGWARHKYDADEDAQKPPSATYEYPPPTGCGEYYYTHPAAPETEFWYPIPLSNKAGEDITTGHEPTPNNTMPEQTTYLFASTFRLHLHTSTKPRSKYHARGILNLRTKSGLWAGILTLHNSDEIAEFNAEETLGPLVELVAISRGTRVNAMKGEGLHEHDDEERPKDSELYEYYNVLWVEWKENVAYRRAGGRVLRSVWEGEGAEAVELVLG